MKQKFVVFDIDGTYFRFHLYWEINLALARENKLHPEINQLALERYEAWRKRAHATAFEDFDTMTVEKINELLSEIDPEPYDKHLPEILEPLLDYTYVFPKKLKEDLQKQGYMALAISGSRMEEVSLFAKHHGFDDWIGQTWHRTPDGKNFTGKISPTYKDKHVFLQQFIDKHNLTLEGSYAVGDTAGDISMFEMVENPIAFNPNQLLLDHAKAQGWKIVVERKSIAYTLEHRNGQYVLA